MYRVRLDGRQLAQHAIPRAEIAILLQELDPIASANLRLATSPEVVIDDVWVGDAFVGMQASAPMSSASSWPIAPRAVAHT